MCRVMVIIFGFEGFPTENSPGEGVETPYICFLREVWAILAAQNQTFIRYSGALSWVLTAAFGKAI